ALEAIIRTCLEKAPAGRFQSAPQLLTVLRALRDPAVTAPAETGRTRGDSAVRATDRAPICWWQFHKAAVAAVYLSMLWPLSYVRGASHEAMGLGVFLAGLVSVLVATT